MATDDAGSMRRLIEDALPLCLRGRPGEDVVAMCLRKPESEANDALRAAINIDGSSRGHIARRESHLGVARTDLTVQDLPSGYPLAAIEAKAVTSADALAPGFGPWFSPQVAADVAKLRRTLTG